MPRAAMACAKAAYRPLCSPSPWATANVWRACGCSHARYARRVPSAERTCPSVAAVSVAKVAEAPQHLECLLLRLEQRRRVCADAVERVSPFGAWRALRMEAVGRRVEEDPFALDLLEHRPFRQHV